ncbi:MAG: retroviral-like aspartic protease family protein [Microcoleus sp.]
MKLFKAVLTSIILATVCGSTDVAARYKFDRTLSQPSITEIASFDASFVSQPNGTTVNFHPISHPNLTPKTFKFFAQQPAETPSDSGGEILQQLSQCVAGKIPNTQQPTLEAIQAVSMECVLRVVILDPDGKVRSDANSRMIALLKVTGTTLPKSSSQGQASVKLTRVADSQVFTVPVTIGGQQRSFLLDTGASNSIVDSQLAQQLGLAGVPIPSDILAYFVVGNDCSKISANLHSLPPLAVEAAKVEGINGMGLPKTAIPGNASGVLGLDFLQGFDVVVNPKTLQLQLLPPSPAVAGAIPLAGKLGVMTAQVKINGKGPFTFLLDTGADAIVVSQRLASTLSLDVANAKNVEVRGFCGNETAKKIKLDRVSLQEHEATELDGVVLNNKVLDLLGVDGIVGQNFLTQYNQHWRFGKVNELGFPEEGSLVLTPAEN